MRYARRIPACLFAIVTLVVRPALADDRHAATEAAAGGGAAAGAASSSFPRSTTTAALDGASAPATPIESDDPQRTRSLQPAPAEPPPAGETKPGAIRFQADPVGDGALLGMAAGFAILSGLILDTGEIRPQQIDPNFDTSHLLGIDRAAIHQTPQSSANTISNIGLYTALGFAVLDPVLTYARDGKQAALVDAVMYAEAIGFTIGLTNLAKIAFRRPRPIAYIERDEYIAAGGDPAMYNNASTDSSLSFFSGHASQTAAVAATATYIAFSRSPKTWRPWATLGAGLALTTFVSYERVRSGAHFPTDVIAGALAGAGVGVLVVHLHREDSARQRPVWIGAMPLGSDGGMASVGGLF